MIEANPDSAIFRSVMHAQWAVFFKEAKVRYYYHERPFADDEKYVPDFFLFELNSYVEVSSDSSNSDIEKMLSLMAEYSGMRCFWIQESPSPPLDDFRFRTAEDGIRLFSPEGCDYMHMWCSCPHCNKCDIQFMGRSDRIGCSCPKSPHGDKGYNYQSEVLVNAFTAAMFSFLKDLPRKPKR